MVVNLDSCVSVSWSSTPRPDFILLHVSDGVYEKVHPGKKDTNDCKSYVFDVPGCDEATVECAETAIVVRAERVGSSKMFYYVVNSTTPFDVNSCEAKINDGSIIVDVHLLPLNQKIITVKK